MGNWREIVGKLEGVARGDRGRWGRRKKWGWKHTDTSRSSTINTMMTTQASPIIGTIIPPPVGKPHGHTNASATMHYCTIPNRGSWSSAESRPSVRQLSNILRVSRQTMTRF